MAAHDLDAPADELATQPPSIRLLCWNMGAGGPGPRATWPDVWAQASYAAALLQEAPNPWYDSTDHQVIPEGGAPWCGGES